MLYDTIVVKGELLATPLNTLPALSACVELRLDHLGRVAGGRGTDRRVSIAETRNTALGIIS